MSLALQYTYPSIASKYYYKASRVSKLGAVNTDKSKDK